MPDKRQHRGPHPKDAELFDARHFPALRAATDDLCWLLSRGYARKSSIEIVGDRYDLAERQRKAVGRCACADAEQETRRQREVRADRLRACVPLIDGYNILTTVEAALAGGVILVGRDGCYRDMASMHSSFKRVRETGPGIELIGRTLESIGSTSATWYLDRPVSNSGRLRKAILELAAANGWAWEVELVANPDRVLIESGQLVVSADSAVIDGAAGWFNLAPIVVAEHIPDANLLRL